MLAELALFAMLHGAPSQSPKAARDYAALARQDLFLPKAFLLYAVAENRANWVVRHVYVGPQTIVGKTIRGEFQPLSIPFSPTPGVLPAATGAGLFWVKEHDSGKLTFCQSNPGPWMPAWSCLDKHYLFPDLLRTAKVLERIYRETDDKRLAAIDGFVKGNKRLEAVTAFRQLIACPESKGIEDYLLQLSEDEALPIVIQTFLHDRLTRKSKDWVGSKREVQMVEWWVSGPWRDKGLYTDFAEVRDLVGSDEVHVVRCLGTIPEKQSSAARARLLGFEVKAMANAARSAKFKEELLASIKRSLKPFPAQDRDEVFAYLVKATKTASKTEVRAAAARLLGTVAPFDDAQELQLHALLAGTREKLVRRELQALLEE